MKIKDVRAYDVVGEERSGLAIYEIDRGGLKPGEVSRYRQRFTEIESDEGVIGVAIGGSPDVLSLGKRLIGLDPRGYEHIWHTLTSRPHSVDGRSRQLSTLDVALWDLLAKVRGESVCQMLGGPVQESIRAYAAMLGFLPEPESAAKRSAEMVAQGFTGVKWYLPFNELAGPEGFKHNVAMISAVREAVGPDIDIMVDCILSDASQNSLQYVTRLARECEKLNVTWLEEPLRPEDLGIYARLRKETITPISFGEHLKHRDQFVTALRDSIACVIQPEMHVVGGMTEMRKLVALSSSFGVPFVPHANESCRNSIHLSFANPKRACPIAEWGVKINHNVQHFFKDFYQPSEGFFHPPAGPGFGYEIDPSKVVERIDLA
jgi:L-rhamnonate dehydratase